MNVNATAGPETAGGALERPDRPDGPALEQRPSGIITLAGAAAAAGDLHVPRHVIQERQREWDRLCVRLRRYCMDDEEQYGTLLTTVVAEAQPLEALKELLSRMEQGTFRMPQGIPTSFRGMMAQRQPAGPNRQQRRAQARAQNGTAGPAGSRSKPKRKRRK